MSTQHAVTSVSLRSLVGATALAAALCATACAPAAPVSVFQPAAVLLPGSSELATTAFRDSETRYGIVQDSGRGTGERLVATGFSATRVATWEGRPALLLISATSGRGRTFVDSALVLRDGLAPVWEVSHSGPLTKRYQYRGAHVSVVSTGQDSRRALEHTYEDASGIWDVRFADKVITSRYGVDQTSRQIVRRDVQRRASVVRSRLVPDTSKALPPG